MYDLFWTAYSTRVDEKAFERFFGVPLQKMYGMELRLAKLLGFVTGRDGVYEMTLKGAFYDHYYKYFFDRRVLFEYLSVQRKRMFLQKR